MKQYLKELPSRNPEEDGDPDTTDTKGKRK